MTDKPNDEILDLEIEQALRSLPRERRPPVRLEDGILHDLRAEGLLHPARPARHPWMKAAAALVLLSLGFAAGTWWRGDGAAPDDRSPRFLLLLHETPGAFDAESPEEQRAAVDEYKAWAAEGVRSGFLVDGEKLKSEARLLPDPGASPPPGESLIGGYFVLRAADYDAALRLARSCPHLRHGGVIEVREIDPV